MSKLRALQAGDSRQLIPLFKYLTEGKIEFHEDDLLKDPNIKCLVIEEDGQLIGFGSLIIHRLPIKGIVARIEDVVIHGNQQGRGLGKLLVNELISIAKKKNVCEIDLTSNKTRLAVRKLYESLGFKIRETDTFRLHV